MLQRESEIDAIKDRVLTENTAQAVLKHLRFLSSNRKRVITRWVWELLQNARDASRDAGGDGSLVVSVEYGKSGDVVFQHNGAGFREEEVCHLIFHGSTKVDDENSIGEYGSGFLTTHLLSPEISISGGLKDGQSFDFALERRDGSVDDLRASMDMAWEEFKASRSHTPSSVCDGFTTRFRYAVEGEDAVDAVCKGLSMLKRCAPFLVAFNRELSQIRIEDRDESIRFEVNERRELEGGIQEITVAEIVNGVSEEKKYVLVTGDKSSISVPLDVSGDGMGCTDIEDVPRLFLGFPLVGTEDFSFPAVVNSVKFSPEEGRDGVPLWLNENDKGNIENQSIFEEACELLVNLVWFAASQGWRDVYKLMTIPSVRDRIWFDSSSLREGLVEWLITPLQETEAVRSDRTWLSVKDSIIPCHRNDEGVTEALWALLHDLAVMRDKLPVRRDAVGWETCIRSWADVEELDFDEILEKYNAMFDCEKLAKHIHDTTASDDEYSTEDYGSIKSLREMLDIDDYKLWLNGFYKLLMQDGYEYITEKYCIVPDQSWLLYKLNSLYRDVDLDDELKNIAELLEYYVTTELRDKSITTLDDKYGRGEYKNDRLIREILKRLVSASREDEVTDRFKHASVRLFAWLVKNNGQEHLRDFPVFSDRVDGDHVFITLGANDAASLPFAPVKAWVEGLSQFSDLFHTKCIVSSDFFEAVDDLDVWERLADENLMRRSAVFFKEVRFKDFLPDLPSPDDDHETSGEVAVSNIAFLTESPLGVIDRVRQNRARAMLFWRFVTEWLIQNDPGALDAKSASCHCGDEHQYFPASWLSPLIDRQWIPIKDRRSAKASAETLAPLLKDADWELSLLQDKDSNVSRLLDVMNIAETELMMNFVSNSDEMGEKMRSIVVDITIEAERGNLKNVESLVEIAKSDPDATQELVEDFRERREREKIISRNHELGSAVEDLVKKVLESHGFTVKRTGVGSDFEISAREIDDGDLGRLSINSDNRSWLVEVKSTRYDRVRMSVIQAETAVEEGSNFLLCVVPLDDDGSVLDTQSIGSKMRFVENMGCRLADIWSEVERLESYRENTIDVSYPGIRLEIQNFQTYISVSENIWRQHGFGIDELAGRLKGIEG